MTHQTSTSFQIPEPYYTTLFEALAGNNALLQTDAPRFTILAASPSYIQQAGTSKEAMIGNGIFEAFPGIKDSDNTGARDLLASLNHVLRHKELHQVPMRYDTAGEDGQFVEHYWIASNKPVFYPDGEVAYIVHTGEEITGQVKAKRREVQMEGIEKAFGLFMHAPMVVGMVDGDDYVLEMANDAAYKLWGKGPEILGKPILQALPELERQGIIELFDRVRLSDQPYIAHEVPVVSFANGREERHYFNLVYQPYYSKNSTKATGVFTISHDVTEQVEARQTAQESEEKYRNLFESMDQGYCKLEIIFEGDRCVDYRYLEINPSFERHLGMSGALGKTIREIAPGIEPKWFGFYGGVALTGNPIRIEEESKAFNKWFEVYAVRVGRAEERKVGVFFTDITKRKVSELLLKDSQALLRTVFDASPNSLTVYEEVCNSEGQIEDFKFVIVNDFTLKTTGRADLIGKLYAAEFPNVRHTGVLDKFIEVATTGMPADFEKWYEGEGMRHWFRFIVNKGGKLLVVTTEDITKRKEVEKAILESEQRFCKLADESPIFVFIIDAGPLAPVSYWNKTWLHYTGQTAEEAFGRAWNGIIHPDDVSIVMKHYTPAFEAREPYFIAAVRVKRHDGVYRYHSFKGNPRYSSNGEFAGYVGVGFDIHEQKVTEEGLEEIVVRRTEELQWINKELQRSNQNLEEFAHAASHDLKEPIRKITFFTHQLKDQLASHLKETEQRSFNRIENATERMGNLIDDLLLYSHVSQRPHETEAVDLNEKIKRVLEDLDLDIEEKKAVIDVGTLPVVQGYRRQLQQLFQNLITNALKYSKANVRPRIDITASQATKGEQRYSVIAVKDNGIGFDEQYADKIFQMFSRLHGKGEYSGTGVGLSIVKKVVENHNGFIEVESEVNKGSIFKVYLPVQYR